MPLLISPIDGSPMRQIQRFGIELDVCPTSGGVWLDRGELEKLMLLIKESAEQEARMMRAAVPHNPEPYPAHSHPSHAPHQSHGDSRYQGDASYSRKPYKQKTGLQRMMDIFDFD